MGETIYSDNTDINGVNYPTVGENIRRGAKELTYESVAPVFGDNKDAILTNLNADHDSLRNCVLFLLTGSYDYLNLWGDSEIAPPTEEDKQKIKTFLGII